MTPASIHNAEPAVNPTPDPTAAAAFVLPDPPTIEAGALDALARGLTILPVDPATKAPKVAAQAYIDGRRNMTPADVRRFARRGAVFGVALKPSRLVALDLDALDPTDAGPFAPCFTGPHVVLSRSGGRHAFYGRPDGMPAKRTIKAGALPVDILGKGYIILWAGHVPPPTELPPIVASVITNPPTSGGGAVGRASSGPRVELRIGADADDLRAFIGAECADVEQTIQGGRNDRLNLATFRTARRAHLAPGIEGEARAALELAGLASGLSLAEVRRTVAGAWERGQRNPYVPRPSRAPWIQGDNPTTEATPAPWAGWFASADAFIVEHVKHPAARERDRRLAEVAADTADGDGAFTIGTRVLAQRAGVSPTSAARGARHMVEVGLWEVASPPDLDLMEGTRKATGYRLARPFGDGDTFQGMGAPTGRVSPSAKSSVALRVGFGKHASDGVAYLSTRWRTYDVLRREHDAGRSITVVALAGVLGMARRTIADHLTYFHARGVLNRTEEATGGRPRGLWTLAADAGQAIARVTEWGRATLDKRWRAAQAAWAALRAWAGRPTPARGEQSFGLRIDRFAKEHGAVVSAVPS